MRKTATWVLVVGISAMSWTGAARAQDEAPPSTSRGSFVVAAGDKVHGFLRGGETHAIRVHLAKGDVYSFKVNSQKRGDPLLMHLTFLDPSRRELNDAARVMHRANGKKVTVGPFKAPATGEYVIELYAQTWFGGDYWATSTVRGARRTVVRVPGDGSTVGVDIAAGSTLQLRGMIASFSIATPGAEPARVGKDDALVVSMRTGKLATSETGAYWFGVPGTKGTATLEIRRPRWKAITVEAPRLPEGAADGALFDFLLNGWKEQHALTVAQAQLQQQMEIQAATMPRVVSAPVPVDALAAIGPATATTLFLSPEINAAGNLGYLVPAPVVEPPPANPQPPVDQPPLPPQPAQPPAPPLPPLIVDAWQSTTAGTPTRFPPNHAPTLPNVVCQQTIGAPAIAALWSSSAFNSSGFRNATWRDTPWALSPGKYDAATAESVLPNLSWAKPIGNPTTDPEDPDMPVRRTFELRAPGAAGLVLGELTTTARYSVDGHPVAGLLATGGDTTVTWTIAGGGALNERPFSVKGEWKVVMRGDGAVQRRPCTFDGWEVVSSGSTRETLRINALELTAVGRRWMRPIGQVTISLDDDLAGIHQTVEETFRMRTDIPANMVGLNVERFISLDKVIRTFDSSTGSAGVEHSQTYDFTLMCD